MTNVLATAPRPAKVGSRKDCLSIAWVRAIRKFMLAVGQALGSSQRASFFLPVGSLPLLKL